MNEEEQTEQVNQLTGEQIKQALALIGAKGGANGRGEAKRKGQRASVIARRRNKSDKLKSIASA